MPTQRVRPSPRPVLEEVRPRRKPVPYLFILQQVIDGPRHAVALRLPGHADGIEFEQPVDELGVLAAKTITVRPLGHLRAEHRIVLGKWVVTFDLKVGLTGSGDAVEEDGFLDRGDESVADAAEYRVVRPDGQVVLPALGQPPRVMGEVTLRVLGVDPRASATAMLTLQRPASTSSAETSV